MTAYASLFPPSGYLSLGLWKNLRIDRIGEEGKKNGYFRHPTNLAVEGSTSGPERIVISSGWASYTNVV